MNIDSSSHSTPVVQSIPPAISLVLQKKFQDAGCFCILKVDQKTTTLIITCKGKAFAAKEIEITPES